MAFICPECNRKFPSKHLLANHMIWHKKGYREKQSKTSKELWHNKEYRERMTGENNPRGMLGVHRYGEDAPNYKGNDISSISAIHQRAHIADPPPKDGKCEICGKVKDKYGKSKLVHSNIDHSYKMPINPEEWWWVHHSCHMKHDIDNNIKTNTN